MKNDSFNSEGSSDKSCEETLTETKEDKTVSNLELINAISETLTAILEENKKSKNDKEKIKSQSKLPFYAASVPQISIKDYLIRIQTYSNIEKSTLVLSLSFIDRLCELTGIILTYHNIHRILFVAVLIAIKYNEDDFYDNKYYSEIAGVKLKELKLLEFTYLQLTDFNLYVSEKQYEKYEHYLDNYGKLKSSK